MRPHLWHPPVELSSTEAAIVKRIKRAKLFVFLRSIRHLLFDEAFQAELATLYAPTAQGHPPIPPAQLALTTLLQAYTGASDAEAIEALTMDRRWQVVLDCLDCEQAPFSQATLVRFRQALIIHQLDRRLIERTLELATQTQGFSARSLRAALDSSPLWGAGKVEDTYNLLGHALRKALSVIAAQQGRELAAVATEAGAQLVSSSSLKAALDLDWDDPEQKNQALVQVLGALTQVETYLNTQGERGEPVVENCLEVAHQVEAQDVEYNQQGEVQLRGGVAKDRRISVEDEDMRHGRKSRRQRIDGYKRHVLRDLDSGLVRAVGVTPANVAEASITPVLDKDLERQQIKLEELHIDRAYLSSSWVKEREEEMTIYCKGWSVRNGQQFSKTSFSLNWENHLITCPQGVSMEFKEGSRVKFPSKTCQVCPLRERCTRCEQGRSISIHPDEKLLRELRERQLTTEGRAKLRERVKVEHSLAHISQWQGERARYKGSRKNLFDLRRMAVIYNLHVLVRQWGKPEGGGKLEHTGF